MAKEVLDTIMSIQPKDSSAGTGDTRENTVYRIADDMLDKVPPDYISHEVSGTYKIYFFTVCLGESKAAENGCFIFHEYIPAARN